jgi:hypothetical protein
VSPATSRSSDEVTVILPDSKVAPKVQIPLAAFEYRPFSIISSLGLGNVYNARISVRVIDGQGKVTAYGSVIDQKRRTRPSCPRSSSFTLSVAKRLEFQTLRHRSVGTGLVCPQTGHEGAGHTDGLLPRDVGAIDCSQSLIDLEAFFSKR